MFMDSTSVKETTKAYPKMPRDGKKKEIDSNDILNNAMVLQDKAQGAKDAPRTAIQLQALFCFPCPQAGVSV